MMVRIARWGCSIDSLWRGGLSEVCQREALRRDTPMVDEIQETEHAVARSGGQHAVGGTMAASDKEPRNITTANSVAQRDYSQGRKSHFGIYQQMPSCISFAERIISVIIALHESVSKAICPFVIH